MSTAFTRRSALAAVAASASSLSFSARAASKAVPTSIVHTTLGKVRGLRAGGLSRFLGIPYGGDTSNRRFQTAVPPEPWAGIRDCNSLGAKTLQGPLTIRGTMGGVIDPHARALPVLMKVAQTTSAGVPESEDCLVLNVITPEATSRRKRPVMVWLHGGGFAMGSGFDPMSDGSVLAATGDIVHVSLNHRLNAMGFLYLAGLHEDFADSDNVGMLDIVLALEWVCDNIAQFGGDPGNVTIFGQSGGGAKVSTLLGMPVARGLFHKAIVMSGPVVRAVEQADAQAIAEQTLAKLGVARGEVRRILTMDPRAVSQAASAIRLPSLHGGIVEGTLAPVADGHSLPAHPFHPQATLLSRDVPVMIGVARDEATLFMAGDLQLGAMPEDVARARFRAELGDAGAGTAFAAYRAAYPQDFPSYLVSAMMTDRLFRSHTIDMADRKSAQRAAPVFMYRVDYRPRVIDQLLRSPHGTEVPLVLGTKVPAEFIGSGSEVDRLSAAMMGCWLRFARTGNPAGSGLSWPRYEVSARQTMIFDTTCRMVADPDPVGRDPAARGLA